MLGNIYIVRHGHGRHQESNNPDPNDSSLRDANLTTKGELQSVVLGQNFIDTEMKAVDLESIGVIITSPLRRAVQTTLLAFSSIIDKRFYAGVDGGGVNGGIDLVIDPNLQNIHTSSWNFGSPVPAFKAEWPNLDCSLLKSPWPQKTEIFSPARAEDRAAAVREDLWKRINTLKTAPKRTNIVVITHRSFIPKLAKDVDEEMLALGNAECLTLQISNNSGIPMLFK